MYNVRNGADVAADAVVVWARQDHRRGVRIFRKQPRDLRRLDRSGDAVFLHHGRIRVNRTDPAQRKAAEHGLMAVPRHDQFAAPWDAGHDGRDDAPARAVDQKIGGFCIIELAVFGHGACDDALGLEQVVSAYDLGDVAVDHVFQKRVVAEAPVESRALVPGHVKGHGVLARVIDQKWCDAFACHSTASLYLSGVIVSQVRLRL